MKASLIILSAVFAVTTASPFVSNFINGFQPNRYTSVDLSQVDFDQFQRHGHDKFLRVPDSDGSGEDFYNLVGVAPSSAVQGGSATTYSANIGNTVPIYSEWDDDNDDLMFYKHVIKAQPSMYSAIGSPMPYNVRAEGTVTANNNYVVLLDD